MNVSGTYSIDKVKNVLIDYYMNVKLRNDIIAKIKLLNLVIKAKRNLTHMKLY